MIRQEVSKRYAYVSATKETVVSHMDINHVADCMQDVLDDGWHILLNAPWKPGVRLVHAAKYGPAEGQGSFNIFFVGVRA